ncbi:MAG TPA: Nif3-like dinuclear metal center hexameric protein [Bryobacteraceae bacterium]|nr:Nif3-like dinuclear metal center hexameric protein [Bryobacteraceae bacterium]
MPRRLFLALMLVTAGVSQTAPPTAQDLIQRIQVQTGLTWKPDTVDTFKAGSPGTPVTCIAVTMMATLDVLERAAAANCNLIITHEPTFYNHLDTTAELAQRNDPVLAQKQRFIQEHHLVVWRFHDYWHQRAPDGIQLGMTKALGWESLQDPADPHLFRHPSVTLNQLAVELQHKLGIRIVRVVGDPALRVSKVAMLPGAADSLRQMAQLARPDVDALVIGEAREWETVEYAADAVTEHKAKGLIILGHIPSEQAGMAECARWLQTFIHDVPVRFIEAAEPFWPPTT